MLLALIAAVYDIRYRRVPNWLVLAGVIIGVGLNAFVYETDGLWLALRGLGLAMIIYFPLYLLRGMGAGDVKLMAAIGSMVGPGNWFAILVFTSLAGAVAALILVASRGRLGETFGNVAYIVRSVAHRLRPYEGRPDLDVRTGAGLRLPHAAVIAVGTLVFVAISRQHGAG